MLETLTKVRVFCCLVGHNQPFIKGFAHMTRPHYDVLGKEVKMGPVQLPPEVQKALMLVFADFDKPFLLEMDASK